MNVCSVVLQAPAEPAPARSSAAILMLHCCFAARYNGHFQAPGPGPRPQREHQGPDTWTGEGLTSDLFTEINLPEIQKLKQQLVTVS